MKTNTRKNILFNAQHGNSAVRLKAIQSGKHTCAQDKQQLEAAGKQQTVDFTQRYEAAMSQTITEQMRPTAITSEIRDASLMNLMAWAMCIVELVLALFFALTFSMNPFFVGVVTLAAIFIVKTSLLAIWRSPDRPQTTRRELRKLVLIPSFIITLLALAVLIFSRGPLALLLFPLISLSLGALSFGICFLSAGLMAYAYSLSWSKHAAKKFNATAKEHAETVQLEEALLEMEEELKPKKAVIANNEASVETGEIMPLLTGQTALVRSNTPKVKTHVFNSLLVLIAAVWMAGCNNSALTSFVPPSSVTSPASISEPTQLAIYVDWSLSGKDQALLQASQNVVTALPMVAEKYNVQRVTAAHFGADGWDAEPITALSLPIFQIAAPDETENLIGLVRADHEKKVRTAYQAELQKKLASLTPEMLLPSNVPEPKCTDIQGVLNRISKTQQRQISIVITDGAENCASALQTVEVTQPLVIVLLSEKGSSLSHELYEQRRQQLAAAVPRAVIVPHFDAQLLEAVNQAVAGVKGK